MQTIGFFIPLPKVLADQFPDLGEDDTSRTHTTLLVVGDVPSHREQEFLRISQKVLGSFRGPVTATLGPMDYFVHTQKDRVVPHVTVSFDAMIHELRAKLVRELLDADFTISDYSPTIYRPHVTLGYLQGLSSTYTQKVPTGSWSFDAVEIWDLRENPIVIPLGTRRTASSSIERIHVYDFDNTLFRSPHPPEDWKGGWWGNPSSLSDPMVPEVPSDDWWVHSVVRDCMNSCSDPKVFTVVMTGRIEKFRRRVQDLLRQQGLTPNALILSKGGPTEEFKLREITGMVKTHTEATVVEIWEDRLNHLRSFVDHVESLGKVCVPHPVVSTPMRTAAGKYKSKTKDAEGNVHYEYGPRQIHNRHKEKAERIDTLRESLKDLRQKYKKDLKSEDEKTRLTALAVALIDQTCERVGNSESAKEGHYGVTGFLKSHFSFKDGKCVIKYVGKSGVDHEKEVTDHQVRSVLKNVLEGKSKDECIFNCDGVSVGSSDVNEYLKDFDITAKDIRGFHANDEMRRQLKSIRSNGKELPKDRKEKDKILKDEFNEALEATAEFVGHEPATLKNQYLVPWMMDSYLHDGTVLKSFKKEATLTQTEKEDDSIEDMIKPLPKSKPPRDDLRKRKVDVEDPDKESLARDRMASRVARRVRAEKAVNPWQEFWDQTYKGKKLKNTDPETRDKYPEVDAATLHAKDKSFQAQVKREFAAWNANNQKSKEVTNPPTDPEPPTPPSEPEPEAKDPPMEDPVAEPTEQKPDAADSMFGPAEAAKARKRVLKGLPESRKVSEWLEEREDSEMEDISKEIRAHYKTLKADFKPSSQSYQALSKRMGEPGKITPKVIAEMTLAAELLDPNNDPHKDLPPEQASVLDMVRFRSMTTDARKKALEVLESDEVPNGEDPEKHKQRQEAQKDALFLTSVVEDSKDPLVPEGFPKPNESMKSLAKAAVKLGGAAQLQKLKTAMKSGGAGEENRSNLYEFLDSIEDDASFVKAVGANPEESYFAWALTNTVNEDGEPIKHTKEDKEVMRAMLIEMALTDMSLKEKEEKESDEDSELPGWNEKSKTKGFKDEDLKSEEMAVFESTRSSLKDMEPVDGGKRWKSYKSIPKDLVAKLRQMAAKKVVMTTSPKATSSYYIAEGIASGEISPYVLDDTIEPPLLR